MHDASSNNLRFSRAGTSDELEVVPFVFDGGLLIVGEVHDAVLSLTELDLRGTKFALNIGNAHLFFTDIPAPTTPRHAPPDTLPPPGEDKPFDGSGQAPNRR